MDKDDKASGADAAQIVYTYALPKDLAEKSGVKSFGLVMLTPGDEVQASKRCHNDAIRLTGELAKASPRYVDGAEVNVHDGTADAAISRFHPKVRSLLILAYNKLHSPTDSEVTDFFDGEAVSTG